MLLNLPNPPGKNVYREYAGGFGTLGSLFNEVLLPSYLVYGASALDKSGCPYEVLDAQAKGYDSVEVVNAVKVVKPDILITWVSLPSLYDDLGLLNNIKEAVPETLIITLGTVCNVIPEEILKSGSVDLLIKGNYLHYNLILNVTRIFMNNPINQNTFDLIGGAIYRQESKVVHSTLEAPGETLDELSPQIYNLLPLKEYIEDVRDFNGKTIKCIPIVTSVGCPHGCSYCPYPLAYGKKIVHKSIDNILDEIEFLKMNFGINGFLFRDQVFTYDKERVAKLCDEIVKRDLDIKWFVEARTDQVTVELLSKMKSAGCFRIHYGVETGAPEILIKIGKPGLRVETVKQTFQITKKLEIFAMAHIILGLPGENKDTLKNTLSLIYELNPDQINLNIFTPYPGTKLFKMAVENKWIKTYDWSKYTSHDAVIHTNDLAIEDLTKARTEIKCKFRNFKLLNDNNYRMDYIKMLPSKIFCILGEIGRV
jgi:radical SAM superfamily enzyme YgiQ (UPF0313 family)